MRWWAASVVVLIAGLGVRAEEPPREMPSPVVAARVVARDVAASRTFVGTVAPSRESVVGSEFSGIVEALHVREGDRVEAKDPLATLRSTILDRRREAAAAELRAREEELRELENGSRPEEIDEARAQVDEAQAQVDLEAWQLEAAQRLYENNRLISEDELREAELALQAARQRLRVRQALLALVEAGPREERVAQVRARLEAQRAEVERLEEEKRRYVVRAPFAGWVVEEATEAGQWLGAGSPVVRLAALDAVDVRVPVLEDYVTGLAEGLGEEIRVPVSVGAIPGRVFYGTAVRIVPRADERARTFPVEIRLANEATRDGVLLGAGMFARATLPVGRPEPSLLVPLDAIVLGGATPVVWTVSPEESRAVPLPVTTGLATADGLIQVRGPLEPGMPVVVRGNERLRPGQLLVVTGEPGR